MEVTPLAGTSLSFPVRDPSEVGTARRAAVALADHLGGSEIHGGNVALVVTELATNLVRHGGGGELLMRSLAGAPGAIEIVAIDRGPGMASVEAALRDGYSTGGTSGHGLGAVRRIADRCEIFSAPGAGTAVVARLGPQGSGRTATAAVSGVSVAKQGEPVCGDAWDWTPQADGWSVLVADGLGHGPDAARAATEAVRIYRERAAMPAGDIVGAVHAALRPTRGAAVAIAEVRPTTGQVTFTGVGNIGGTLLSGDTPRSMVSHAGIVGHECRKIQTFSYPWTEGTVIVLFSDGLQSRWTLDRYPGLRTSDPALLAGVLYRDFARGRDDVTVVAGRLASVA
jgi:anti-sigma regulatory factor (Ser/Thr protein kinase)